MILKEKITTESAYKKVMQEVDRLMAKGSENVTKKELADIRKMAMAAQAYEANKFVIDEPTTLAGIIEMKMYEMRLKQKDLAKKLNVSDAKLSLIMNGKQKPDILFLKAVHQKLKVSGDFLLQAV
ncbi:MAG: helix-turn-helix domain-containing protein [Ferruginibacter sp.]|nr:helix-turn-helix domain-containing protein [Ferruginibacter sp.]